MFPSVRSHSSGLDISLVGAILAIVSFYIGGFDRIPGDVPHLIRFFDKPPGTQPSVPLPQDAALLLLIDPSTTGSTSASAGVALPGTPLWTLLVFVGLAMVVLGPVWAYVRR